MYTKILVLLMLTKWCSAVIYSLNESEYNLMPALFHLDPYDACLADQGVYCVLDVALYSHTQSQLLTMIQGYSAQTMKHFNHTQIHRGVCVTSTCERFIASNSTKKDIDLNRTLEACLNDSLWNNYKLMGKIDEIKYCNRHDDTVTLDVSDITVAVVYLLIILLNAVGSLYDVLMLEKDEPGNPYLLSFSLRRNWDRLVAPINTEKEPRLERLKLFHGLRTLTMICVFFSHTVLMMAFAYVENPLYIEKSYEDPLKQILYNGSLVTHTFFVMSSFLMAYNLCLHEEKRGLTWMQWPKGVLMRWLRLSPTYALVLATTSTLMRHAGSGPLWELLVGSEAEACRRYWWAHLLYVNNYVYDDAHCAPQTWYLAADTQLFVVGLLVCVVARRPRARAAALAGLFLLALVIAAAHTYFQDLDAVVIQAPESYRNLYQNDDTFRLLYIRGHTNLSTYTLGLAGGFLTYRWQTAKKDFSKFKNHRWAFWLLFPLAVAVILSGGMYYVDGWQPAIWLRVTYAAVYKPLFQLLVVAFIVGCVFKFETIYRGIVEWRGLTWTGRTSYSAFLLHTLFQRALVGSYPAPLHMSDYFVILVLCSTIFVTYVSAAALWLLVEAPVAGLLKNVLEPRSSRENKA